MSNWFAGLGPTLAGAIRRVRKGRATTVPAILVFAVSVAAVSGYLSLLQATLLNPFPGLTDATQLVQVSSVLRADPTRSGYIPFEDFTDLVLEPNLFTSAAAFSETDVSLRRSDTSERRKAVLVTPDYFGVLGVQPRVGRFFFPDDERAAVLSYSLWQSGFGGELSVVGTTIYLNAEPFTIVGVAPPRIDVDFFRSFEVYLPLDAHPIVARGMYAAYTGQRSRAHRWLEVIGRVPDSESLRGATAHLLMLADRLSDAYPNSHARWTLGLRRLTEAAYGTDNENRVKGFLGLVTAAAAFVLILGSVSVASLLGIHSLARSTEFAVRSAIGAPSTSLGVQYLLDFVVVGVLGALLGAIGARVLLPLAQQLRLPGYLDVHPALDASMVAVSAALTALPALVLSLVGAARLIREPLKPEMNSAGLRSTATGRAGRTVLVITQCALASAALILFLLLINTTNNLLSAEHGFAAPQVILASIEPQASGYSQSGSLALYDNISAAMHRVSDVEAVGSVNGLPLLGTPMAVVNLSFRPTASEESEQGFDARCVLVGGEYFEAVGMTLLAGRPFSSTQDSAFSTRVGVINAKLAESGSDNGLQVGDTLRLVNEDDPITIVGIVSNTAYLSVRESAAPMVYFAQQQAELSPILSAMASSSTLAIRTAKPAVSLVPEIRRIVSSIDHDLPLFNVATLSERLGKESASERQGAAIVGGLCGAAILLSLVGIHGLIAFLVRVERREVGIRAALGAEPSTLFLSYVRRGLLAAGTGVLFGLFLSLAFGKYVSSLLYGVVWNDPMAYCVVLLAMSVFVVSVSLLAARKAGTIEPATVLREF